MDIEEFEKGQFITMVKPIETRNDTIGFLSMGPSVSKDYSYVGAKFEFIGIANGLIYAKRIETDRLSKSLSKICEDVIGSGDSYETFPIEKCSKLWDLWVDPNTL